MNITTWIDKGGSEHLKLSDESKYGRHGRGIPVDFILMRVSDGHFFRAAPGLRGLERLSEAEAEMVNHYLKKFLRLFLLLKKDHPNSLGVWE